MQVAPVVFPAGMTEDPTRGAASLKPLVGGYSSAMGTIGDLLGIDLAAAFGQDTPEANDLHDPQEEAHAVDVPVNDDPLHAQMGQREQKHDAEGANPRHEAVLAAIVAETDLEPSHARLDLTLAGDLDLDELGLYAVVSAIEHELRCSFTDEVVHSWRTLGDVLDAADGVGKTRQDRH